MKVKPKKQGNLVPYENEPQKYLPDEGDNVQENPYWLRRIADDDVELVIETPVTELKKGGK